MQIFYSSPAVSSRLGRALISNPAISISKEMHSQLASLPTCFTPNLLHSQLASPPTCFTPNLLHSQLASLPTCFTPNLLHPQLVCICSRVLNARLAYRLQPCSETDIHSSLTLVSSRNEVIVCVLQPLQIMLQNGIFFGDHVKFNTGLLSFDSV